MSHQIDTVHWYSGLKHPRSVTANGGVYMWKDGRSNWDTLTAVFDYGPTDDPSSGFQVVFSSRQHNGDENPSEIYFSNGGELNLITNKVSSRGGLKAPMAAVMGMKENLLPNVDLADSSVKAISSANTGGDVLTSSHVRNWMECVRSRKQPNAPVEAGYAHSIANIMTTAASRTGYKATFDERQQEVIVNGTIFRY
jgi:predicted dehydrogenase